jgi:DNA-binding MarR family transcriptional regulator
MRSRKAGQTSVSPAAWGVVRVGAEFADEFPDGDPAQAEVLATLFRTGAALSQEIDRCMATTFGATQTILNSLAIIDGADRPLTPSEIGERMLVSSGTVTGTVDQLEYRGWVRRLPNPDDRRSVLVEITDDGKAIADRLLPGIRQLEQGVLTGLTPTELATLLKLLGKVLEGVATVAAAEPIPLEGRRNRPRK